MTQSTSSELQVATRPASSTSSKRFIKMAGAAVVSLGLFGTFAMPAYATPEFPEGEPDGYVADQTLVAADAGDEAVAIAAPEGEVAADILAKEKAEREAAEQARLEEANKNKYTPSLDPLPAGPRGTQILAASEAQLGKIQDCTGLLEEALDRVLGFETGDLGTSPGEYVALGGRIVTDGLAPGDVLTWSGRHVAVYKGNGLAVHGGFNGNQTIIFRWNSPDSNPVVVRF